MPSPTKDEGSSVHVNYNDGGKFKPVQNEERNYIIISNIKMQLYKNYITLINHICSYEL